MKSQQKPPHAPAFLTLSSMFAVTGCVALTALLVAAISPYFDSSWLLFYVVCGTPLLVLLAIFWGGIGRDKAPTKSNILLIILLGAFSATFLWAGTNTIESDTAGFLPLVREIGLVLILCGVTSGAKACHMASNIVAILRTP